MLGLACMIKADHSLSVRHAACLAISSVSDNPTNRDSFIAAQGCEGLVLLLDTDMKTLVAEAVCFAIANLCVQHDFMDHFSAVQGCQGELSFSFFIINFSYN